METHPVGAEFFNADRRTDRSENAKCQRFADSASQYIYLSN